MNKQIIATEQAPKAIGPYSQAVKAGDIIFASGMLAIDVATAKIVEGGIEAETRKVLENIKALLGSQGLTLKNVIKTTVFMVDLGDFAKMNAIYSEYFTEECPARSAIQVSKLPLGGLIEIETITQV